MREEERAQNFSRQLLMVGDVLMAIIIAQLASGILMDQWIGLPANFQPPVLIVIVTYLLVGMLARSLVDKRKVTWTTDFTILVIAWGTAAIALTTFFFFSKTGAIYSRLWFGSWLTATPLALILGRIFLAQVLALFGIEQFYRPRALMITDGSDDARLFTTSFSMTTSVMDIVGTNHIPSDEMDAEARKQAISAIKQQIERGAIDTLVVAPTNNREALKSLRDDFQNYSIDILTCPSNYMPNMIVADAMIMDSFPMLLVQSRPIKGEALVLKALEDRVLGSLLLVAFAPLMALIAILIKLDSRGPVFFVQTRHGFNHDEFRMFKFRSMYAGDDGAKQATRDDDRITRIGRWLRRTSLDELPQLINVVQGHMSLVGPRPHAVSQRDAFANQIDSWLARHRVKPGMTGWAQVNGYRGEIENQEDLVRRVEHDLYYIDNWSVLLDLKILFITPLRGFVHPKAY